MANQNISDPKGLSLKDQTSSEEVNLRYLCLIGISVALGGFLMGFDASVISGVVGFIRAEFNLTDLELGWAVGSLTLTATLGMLTAGPASDRFGRRAILVVAAVLYAVSAVASALAQDLNSFILARMIGGLGVGASLIVAPMYLSEIAPARVRGRLVSLNQLNIVIGISAAFFSNYFLLQLANTPSLEPFIWEFTQDNVWRWMLAIEVLPALLFLVALAFVPQSPRWLVMKSRESEAFAVLSRLFHSQHCHEQIAAIKEGLQSGPAKKALPLADLFGPGLRWCLALGIGLAVLQQITGINAVFFYAPMIFEQSGIGQDAAFLQAVLVGMVNLTFTVLAMLLIDRLGRRPLLLGGLVGIVLSMGLLAYGFGSASYQISTTALLNAGLPSDVVDLLMPMNGQVFESEIALNDALAASIGQSQALQWKGELVKATIQANAGLILVAILGFVASFAISLGPIMWVMLSELFPLHVRGIAVSVAGFINSTVSFCVQLLFPWQLSTLGTALTFALYGLFALIGLVLTWKYVPETRNKTLEELGSQLLSRDAGRS